MKPKIERYTEKFINTNYDKKDRKKCNSLRFEWFVNSMHCWKYSSQSYNSKSKIGQEISLGKAQGGDAFFLLANNKIFTLNDDIDIVKKTISESDNNVEFHLIQSKKSHKADLGDFKKFVEIPIKVIRNIGIGEEQKELNKLKYFFNEIIKDNDELEVSFNLSFYTEKNENDIKKLENDWKHELEYTENQYEEYGNVKIELLGSKNLNDLYEQFNSNEYKLFINKNNVMLDNNSFLIGCLTAKELLDAIAPQKESKRILYPDVFKNNLRLYLGETPVNKNIEKTLIEEPKKFHLYNNGLTITTKEIETKKLNNYSISPVNIVNGCQTANSVYNIFKDVSGNEDEVKIPVKIIIANDEEYEKITIRTNSQNGISEKDLISIKNIQKDLEEDFKETIFQNKKFFYKRQNSEDKKSNEADFVITINDILRASFSSLFLMPHKVLGYFDITTNKYIDILFEERFIKLYKVVTILLKIIDEYIEESHIELYRLKYHILYLFYKYINEEDDIAEIETYFVKQKIKYNFEEDIEISRLEQSSDNIMAKLYKYGQEKDIFIRIIEYIVITLKENYPQLLNLDTKIKERILYKTVDEKQRGEKIFRNFKTIFNKNIGDI